MKKIFRILFTISLTLLLFSKPVSALEPGITLQGPATVRVGDLISIVVKMNGTGLHAVQGEIQYQTSQLVYKGSGGVLSNWTFDINGSTTGKVTFLGIDEKLNSPISSLKQIFVLTFQVKNPLATGTTIGITAAKLSASDGNRDYTPTASNFSVKTSAPLSSNALLSKMTVSNATIVPTFNQNTTSYTAVVPFSVLKLNISATAADSRAKIDITNNLLIAGTLTTVKITVTAENGIQKLYTIKVARENDPNYVKSRNANLAGITVEGFFLSPVFNTDVTSYVIWLPYETTKVNVRANPQDARTTVQVNGTEDLKAGADNPIRIVCTAEDGTEKEYRIIAKRASATGQITGSVSGTGSENSSSTGSLNSSQSKSTFASASSSKTGSQSSGSGTGTTSGKPGTPFWAVLAIAVTALGTGYAGGFAVCKEKLEKNEIEHVKIIK